jgi:hypothetical protein
MKSYHYLHCISSHLNTVLLNWSILDHILMFWLIDSLMRVMRQMIETRQMKNIREIKIETRQVMKTKRVINSWVVYKIALKVQTIDKILKNEMIEIIVWILISFLIDECKDFSMIMKMMNHCKNFMIFLKFLMKEFSELLIKMKMKMIVLKSFLLWTIREINVLLMLNKMIFLSEVIVFSLIDFKIMILEI